MASLNQEQCSRVSSKDIHMQTPLHQTLPIVRTLKDALDEAKARLSQLEEERPFSAPKKKRSKGFRRPEGVFRINSQDGTSAREDAELSRFLEEFKRESKLLPSTVKIQSWCRMRRIRQRYQCCFVARKRSVTEECWRRWVLFARMSKYSVQAQRRLFFLRWMNFTLEEQELRSLWQRMLTVGSHHAERGLMKLFSWATRTLKKPSRPSKRSKGISHLASSLPRQFDAIILKAFFTSWTLYLRTKLRHRKLASVHLQRARRLGGKKMWAPERARLCFVMWYRYALFKKRKRANEELPDFGESVAEWTSFMERYWYLKEKQAEAEKRAPTALKRRRLREWLLWVTLVKHLRELEQLAKAHYSSTIKGKLLLAWNRFTKERGKKMRSVRRCLVSWGLWAKRKKRNNSIKRTIVSNVLTHGKLVVLRHWHKTTVEAQTRSLLRHQQFLREKYLPTLKVAMALTDQRIHLVYLGIWQRWSQLAKRRVRWNKVLFTLSKRSRFDRMIFAWEKLTDRRKQGQPKFQGDLTSRDKDNLRRLLLSGAELVSNGDEDDIATTKLQQAVSIGDLASCLSLVKSKKANLTAKTASGQSLLHLAAKSFSAKQVLVVVLLLKVGLSSELEDQNGQTPRSLAVHPNVAYLLEMHYRRISDMCFSGPELSWYRRTYVRKYFSIVSRCEIWQYLLWQLKSSSPTIEPKLGIKNVKADMSLEEYKSCVAARCRGLSKRAERDRLLLRRHFIRQGFAAYNTDAEKRLPLPDLDLGACYPLSNTYHDGDIDSAEYGFTVSQVPNETRVIQLDDLGGIPEAEEVEGNALWEKAAYLWKMNASRGEQIDAWNRCSQAYDVHLDTLQGQTDMLLKDLRNLELQHQRLSDVHQEKEKELATLKEAREASAREILKKTNLHQQTLSSQAARKVLLKKKLLSARGSLSRYEKELEVLREKLRRNKLKEKQLSEKIEKARNEATTCERQLLQVVEKLKDIDVVYQRQCHSNLEAIHKHAKDEEKLLEEVRQSRADVGAMLNRIRKSTAEQQEHALGVAVIERRRDRARVYAKNPLEYYTEEIGNETVDEGEFTVEGKAGGECRENMPETSVSQESEPIESWIAKESSSEESTEEGSIEEDVEEGVTGSLQTETTKSEEVKNEPLKHPGSNEADVLECTAGHAEPSDTGGKKRSNFDEQAYWKAKRRQLPSHQDPLLELTLPPDKESESIRFLVQDIKKAEEAKTLEFMDKSGLLVARGPNNCIDEEKTQNNLEKLYEKSKRLVFNGELLKVAKSKRKVSPTVGFGEVDETVESGKMAPLSEYDVSSLDTESTCAELSEEDSDSLTYLFGNFVGKPRSSSKQVLPWREEPASFAKDLESVWKLADGSFAVETKTFCSADEMSRVEEMTKQSATNDVSRNISERVESPNRFVEFDFEISPNDSSVSELPCTPVIGIITKTLAEKAKQSQAEEGEPKANLRAMEVFSSGSSEEETEKDADMPEVVQVKVEDVVCEKRINLKVAIRDGEGELDVSYSVGGSSSECSAVGFGRDSAREGFDDTDGEEDTDEDEGLTQLVLAKLRYNQAVLQRKESSKRASLHPKTQKRHLEPLNYGPFVPQLTERTPQENRHIVFDPFATRDRKEVGLSRRSPKRRERRAHQSSHAEACPPDLHLSVGSGNGLKPSPKNAELIHPFNGNITNSRPSVLPALQPLFPAKSIAKVKDVKGLRLESKVALKPP